MSDKPFQDQGDAPTALAKTRDTTLPLGEPCEKFAPGRVLGPFAIESFIAEGGFGSVYRARHATLGVVALKVSHVPSDKLQAASLALLQNELEALMQLRHSSLVRAVDHGVLANHHYLALELIEGESLRDYMARRGRVDVIEAIALMRRLAEAIAYCHDRNICHLDITPNNIIVVDPYGPDVKIVDFGVAALGENWLEIACRPTVGTPLYMAPELLVTPPQIGGHCDVYALGLIFYELLSGAFPFRTNGSWQQLQAKKLEGDMRPIAALVPAVPEAVAATVHGLLYAEPAQRTFTAALLADHLKHLYFDILRGTDAAQRNVAYVGDLPAQQPLVGRDDELRMLQQWAAQPSHGAGSRAVLIVGEAGIGKSRVLAELTPQLQHDRAIGYGRCRKYGNVASYSIWRESIGQIAETIARTTHWEDPVREALRELLAEPSVASLAALIPELGALSARSTSPAGRELEIGSAVVSQAVRRLLTTIGAHVPIAIVLEDLHWAIAGTMDVLTSLVSSLLPPGVLVIGTARPELELPSSPALDRVVLQPLESDQVTELLRSLVGNVSSSVIAELQRAIPLLHMGNPLIDTQVILHLKREGYLCRDADGRVVLADHFDRGYAPPTSVASVLERRLGHLTASALDVLGIASLVGRQFSIADLKEVATPEVDAAAVDAAIGQALELSLCSTEQDACTFVHDVIRDHLETTVAPDRMRTLHARIAQTLNERGAAPATLAYHLDKAGDRSAATTYFAAAIEAERFHDPAGASHHLRRALALTYEMPNAPERDRALVRTTYELTRITGLLGKTQESLEELDRCRDALQAPPQDALVMLHSAYARVYYAQGDFPRAVEHSELSLAVTDPDLSVYQCVPANMLGRSQCASGWFGQSIEVLRRGCQLARETDNLVELAHSEGLLGTSLAFVGDFEASARHIAESSRLAEELNDRTRRMGVCLYQTLNAEAAGRWEDGIDTSVRLLALAEEYSVAGLYLYFGTLMAGRHHFHIGELQRARHLLRNAINLSNVFGIRIASSWAHAYLGDVCFVEGKCEEALRWYATGRELGRKHKDGFGIPLSLIGMAHAFAYLDVEIAQVHAVAEEAFAAFEASSNVTALGVGLVRYLDALNDYPDEAEHSAAARARLQRLLARLDVERCEFWPIASLETTADIDSPAGYWQRRAAAEAASVPLRRPAGDSLLMSLATVDGFIPAFATP